MLTRECDICHSKIVGEYWVAGLSERLQHGGANLYDASRDHWRWLPSMTKELCRECAAKIARYMEAKLESTEVENAPCLR